MKRIAVAGIADRSGKRTWRCRLGFHRVRFLPDWADHWVPRCTDCRRPAAWWLREQGAVVRDESGRSWR